MVEEFESRILMEITEQSLETNLLEIACKEGWSFPLQTPLHYSAKEDDKRGQYYLRFISFVNQDGICSFCQKPLGNDNDEVELHHALVSRKDVQGTNFGYLIHDSRNVLLVHHSCHHQVTRELAFKELCKIFPIEAIEEWYYSIPWKSSFRRLP